MKSAVSTLERFSFVFFPAKLDFSDESINYVWPNELSFKLRKTGPGRIEAYLATTSEEKKWLIDYLGSKQINPELVPIALSKQ